MDAHVRPRARVGIIGAGRVGRAFAHATRRRGFEVVAAWSRTDAARQRFADEFGTNSPRTIAEAVDEAELVIVAVPDAQIDSVVRELSELVDPARSPLVVVTSGSWSMDGGEPLRAVGGRVVRIHPLRAITDAAPVDVLDGVVAAITAPSETELAAAVSLATRLGLEPFELADADAATWHAAGVLAAGGITTLLAAARDLAIAAGVAPDVALRAMADLARGAIDSAAMQTPERSLTGPVARGDADTVAAHVDALRRRRPELVDTYREVTRTTAQLAREAGRIDDATLERIDTALADDRHATAGASTWA